MSDHEFEAMQRVLTHVVETMTDLIGAVILACNERNAIDTEKLRGMLDDLASRPDVSTLDRSIIERLLRLTP